MTIHSVTKILIDAATNRTTVGYSQILRQLGVKPTDVTYKRLFGILLEIGTFQHENGLPLVNALVVGVSQTPGIGFFKWLKRKRKVSINLKSTDHLHLWKEIIEDCYSYYSFQKA
jgi:hypothetical protein